LKAQGAIEQPTFTLGDLQDIRSQLLAEIRKEKAQPAPNWNRVRLMENIANGADDGTGGILDDMLATGVSGVEEAHAFSRGLNEKFTRGEMGKILGYGRRGGDAVSPENTMSVVYGKETGRTMDQMIAAAPESRGQIEGWLKSHYLEAVVPGGKFDAGAHRMFMRRMRERGVFERFPELEQQFNQAATATNRAEALGKRAANVRSMSYDGGRSRAALYLNSPTGTEMDRLLEQRSRASIFARGIVRKVGNDPVARQGLKAEFVESVFRASSREDTELGPVLNGASARVRFRELDRNGTMDALGFTAAEKKRLADIVDEVTLIDRKPKDIPDDLVGDAASEAAQFLARWSGANVGGATSKGGASLQSAQIASSKFRQILNKLTTNKAARLIADAQNDPELYKALLTTSRDSTERQKQAFDKIQNWMLGAAATQDERE